MNALLRSLMTTMFALALMAGAACGGASSTNTAGGSPNSNSNTSGSSNSSGSQSGSQSSPSAGPLDPAVSMPSNFPSDFPIYKGVRLTQQAQLISNGKTTWTMGWETLEAVDPVGKWYQTALDQGDWTLTVNANSTSGYLLQFTRKSDSNAGGSMGVDTENGYTKVSLIYATG